MRISPNFPKVVKSRSSVSLLDCIRQTNSMHSLTSCRHVSHLELQRYLEGISAFPVPTFAVNCQLLA